MRLFVPDEPDTVENNIQYRALGRSFYRCLREFDLADLHSQVHDEAVDLLEDILMVLDDPDLDDAHCLDEIVLLYQRRLGVASARHEKRVLKRLRGRNRGFCGKPEKAGRLSGGPLCCFVFRYSSSSLRTAMNASVGSCTLPRERIFFLPSFCFSSSFFLRVMSPP